MRLLRPQIEAGIGEKPAPASGAAEVIGLPGMLGVVGSLGRIHLHSADRIGGRSGAVAGRELMIMARHGGLRDARVLYPRKVFVDTSSGYIGEAGEPDVKQDKPRLLNRLKRIEGQVRGVARMVEEDRYCIDVLTQLQAVRAALARVETEMLKGHLGHCIESAIVSGDQAEQRQKAAELIELLERAAR